MARRPADDPYVYPGTDVLQNRFNLRTQQELERAERPHTLARLQDLEHSPVKGTFDITHYSNTHHAIFKDLYSWAGEFRTTELHKWSENRQDFTTFMPAQLIVPWLNRHLNEEVAKRDNFRGLGRDEFVQRSAQLYLDLNAFHPFREGNGRTQREFLRTLGLNAGYEIDWRKLDKQQLLDATIRTAFDKSKKDHSLHDQLSKAIVSPSRDAALQQAWDRYSAGEDFRPHRVAGLDGWKGTLPDAIRASERAAPGATAFVAAQWEQQARPRIYSADTLLSTLAKVPGHASGPAVYSVRDNGTVHNTVTGRDEYIRLDAGRADHPPRLQDAAERHFRQHLEAKETPAAPSRRGPDLDGL